MAQRTYEKWTRTISTQRVTKVDIPCSHIVRITIRNQQEADLYLSKGVAVYQEEIELPNGSKCTRWFIKVSVYDLAEVAQKD
jgi:ribosomal protein L35AE/L33A